MIPPLKINPASSNSTAVKKLHAIYEIGDESEMSTEDWLSIAGTHILLGPKAQKAIRRHIGNLQIEFEKLIVRYPVYDYDWFLRTGFFSPSVVT